MIPEIAPRMPAAGVTAIRAEIADISRDIGIVSTQTQPGPRSSPRKSPWLNMMFVMPRTIRTLNRTVASKRARLPDRPAGPPARQLVLYRLAADLNEGRAVAAESLQDEPFAAKQPRADVAVEEGMQRHRVLRGQEGARLQHVVGPRAQLDWHDAPGRWGVKRRFAGVDRGTKVQDSMVIPDATRPRSAQGLPRASVRIWTCSVIQPRQWVWA